jgi:hypothetical protein
VHWFKTHHGFSTDTKFGLIAHQLSLPRAIVNAIAIDLLEHASKNDERGYIGNYDLEGAAFNLGVDSNALRNVTNALRNRGFVTDDRITHWEQYQDRSDPTNAERQKRHRDKRKQELAALSASSVTDSNALRNTEEIRRDKIREESSAAIGDFRKVFDAGCEMFPQLASRDTHEIQKWIDAGCSVDLDILPALKRCIGRPLKSWVYFSSMIMDSKAHRETPLPKGNPHANTQRNTANGDKPNKSERARAALLRSAQELGYAD